MNSMSLLIFGIAISGILLVFNGTFNHKYDYSRPLIGESLELKPINISDIKNLKGNIISLQNNGSIIPAWIISGKWNTLISDNNNETSNQNINFTANITMAKVDGTNTHMHKLRDFKLSNIMFQNRTSIINGTVTLTTTNGKVGIPISLSGVPVDIKITNLGTISIDIDRKKVYNHFGDSPIYGTVNKKRSG